MVMDMKLDAMKHRGKHLDMILLLFIKGYCYGFNKVSKNLIIGNRKLLKNGNGMVFGVSGFRKVLQ